MNTCTFCAHGSLADNHLTNYGRDMSGMIELTEALKVNTALQNLKSVSVDLNRFTS